MRVLMTLVLIIGLCGCLGCSIHLPAAPPAKVGELALVGMVTALGGVGEEYGVQRVSYELVFHNGTEGEVYLSWIEPVVGQELSSRLISDDLKVEVGEVIAPNEYLTVADQFLFDAGEASKHDIDAWGSLISGVVVSLERYLARPGR